MKKQLYIIALISAFLTACDKNFLDTKPYDAISSVSAYTSDANAKMSVNGIYNAINQSSSLEGLCFVFTNIGPDGFGWSRDGQIEQGLSTIRHSTYLNTYTAFYRVIRYANDAISNLTNNGKVSKDLANRLVGEAKFMRGMSYFYLWQLYGGVIIMDKPLLPSETYLPRNTADEVKQLVIADFTDAISRLPVSYSSADRGRVTQGAAIAMLGKTYLYDKQWAKAAEQFEKLLKSPYDYKLLDDYSHLFSYKWEDNKEVVYSLQEVMVTDLGSDYDMWYGGRSIYTSGQSYSEASYNIVNFYTSRDGTPIDMTTMPKLSDYGNDDYKLGLDLIPWYQSAFKNADKRLDANILLPGSTFVGLGGVTYEVYWPYSQHAKDNPPAYRIEFSGQAFFSWRKFVMTGNENLLRWDSPTDIPIIRYADVLLMYAEAKNEAEGPSSSVYDAVNLVRNRAGVVNLPSNLSQDELRRNIRLERFHEFPGEGILFFDVRRWKTAATNDPVLGLNHDVLDFRGKKLFNTRL